MTLQQLNYFMEVVKHNSISRAAKALFIAQSSLSQSIKELEEELNITLLYRHSKGISLTSEGETFVTYAKAVIDQYSLLENKYMNSSTKRLCSISTQHYSFAVEAFINLVNKINADEYEFSIKETKTLDIINDVSNYNSELGIIYINDFNQKVINKLLKEKNLIFKELIKCNPHVFISKNNPLAKKNIIKIEELNDYPCLQFDQGENNSYYFNEEILSTLTHKKLVNVSDRATLFNLIIGINGYTISSGLIDRNLNHPDIISVPLDSDEIIKIGYITIANRKLSNIANMYIDELLSTLDVLFVHKSF